MINFTFNEPLLKFLENHKIKYQIFDFTTGAKIIETETVQRRFQSVFKKVFTINDFDNLPKSDPNVFKLLSQKINLKLEEIIYIDDTKVNTDSAAKSGIVGIHYLTNINLHWIIINSSVS